MLDISTSLVPLSGLQYLRTWHPPPHPAMSQELQIFSPRKKVTQEYTVTVLLFIVHVRVTLLTFFISNLGRPLKLQCGEYRKGIRFGGGGGCNIQVPVCPQCCVVCITAIKTFGPSYLVPLDRHRGALQRAPSFGLECWPLRDRATFTAIPDVRRRVYTTCCYCLHRQCKLHFLSCCEREFYVWTPDIFV
jgi:hypothetical protein